MTRGYFTEVSNDEFLIQNIGLPLFPRCNDTTFDFSVTNYDSKSIARSGKLNTFMELWNFGRESGRQL